MLLYIIGSFMLGILVTIISLIYLTKYRKPIMMALIAFNRTLLWKQWHFWHNKVAKYKDEAKATQEQFALDNLHTIEIRQAELDNREAEVKKWK